MADSPIITEPNAGPLSPAQYSQSTDSVVVKESVVFIAGAKTGVQAANAQKAATPDGF